MRRAVCAAVAACLVEPVLAQLYTTDAGVISPSLPQFKERCEWLPRARADLWRAETRLGWAPERWLQLDLVAPFVSQRVSAFDGSQTVRGTTTGLGDLTLASKWALLRVDDRMQSDRLSALCDVHLPTGDDETRIDGFDLGPRAGLGLGAFGASVGLGYTWVRDRHRAAAALRYTQYDSRDGFSPGAEVELDLAWWYRLSPVHFAPSADDIEYRLTVELRSRWQAHDQLGSRSLGNGGGELSAVLGLQCNLTPATSLEGGILLPLADQTESPFGDARVGFLVSFRWSF